MKLAVVEAWHRSLAAGDVDRLVRLSSSEVAIGGPRGIARGHDVLRAWAEGAGVGLEPRRWFCGPGGDVVVAQGATWPADDGGRTPPIAVATRFGVREGLIERIDRFEELGAALAAARLGAADEVRFRT